MSPLSHVNVINKVNCILHHSIKGAAVLYRHFSVPESKISFSPSYLPFSHYYRPPPMALPSIFSDCFKIYVIVFEFSDYLKLEHAATFGGGGDVCEWPVMVAAPTTVRREDEIAHGREGKKERTNTKLKT